MYLQRLLFIDNVFVYRWDWPLNRGKRGIESCSQTPDFKFWNFDVWTFDVQTCFRRREEKDLQTNKKIQAIMENTDTEQKSRDGTYDKSKKRRC